MKSTKLLFLLATCLLFMVSCEYEWIEPDLPPIPNDVSFQNNIMPIFDKSCNMGGCHDAGAFDPDLSAANAYNNLIDGALVDTAAPDASILYTTLKSGSMKTYAEPGDAEIILAWIKQGAKNN
ncbi:hypothetical protein ACFLRY_05520 [Bacteroidota bacterium]